MIEGRIVIWRDEVGFGGRRGCSAEAAACRWYLEHARGPRRRSPSSADPERAIGGRPLHGIDYPGTLAALEEAFTAGLPPAWRGPVIVSLGWGIGVEGLRRGPWLARAGWEGELPQGLTRHSLARMATRLRAELAHRGLIEIDEEEKMETETTMVRERPLVGWKAIADFLGGVSERTARRYEAAHGLPVHRIAAGTQPRAYPSELAAWEAARAVRGVP